MVKLQLMAVALRLLAFLALATGPVLVGLWFWFVKAGGVADPGFVFLSVREVNNRGVLAGTLATESEPVAKFEPEGARVVVLHRVDSLDLNLHAGWHTGRRLPFEVPVNRPVSRPGRVMRDGRPVGRRNVVDNRSRLTAYPLIVASADVEGGVSIRLGPHRAYLAPDQVWGLAWSEGSQGRVEIRDGPDWEERLREELRRGNAVTVFSVENHGRIYTGQVRF